MRWIAIFIALPSVLVAQEAPRTSQSPVDQGVIRAVTQEVLLDFVVRDKRGRLVRDLKPGEIEVYDEGVRQKMTGFRVVTGSDAAGLGSTAASAGSKQQDPIRRLRLVSLVYEGLDNEARRLARQASNYFLKDNLEGNVYVAVFVIGERLHVLQPFTNDLDRLRGAVERATTSNYPQFVAESEAIRKQLEAVEGEGTSAARAAEANLPGQGRTDASGIASASAASLMAQMTLNMLNLEETLTRSQQSRSSLYSLLSLVKEQAALPGRKSVVFFTRGLQVPENMVEEYKSTITAANRAGVSIYAVDARGLTLDAQNTSSASMLNSAVVASRRQQTVDAAPVTPEQAKSFDTAMSSIHANAQQSLGDLAASTGGFLVANTNDLRGPLQQIYEDLLTYYEAAYMPQITEYDGKFHRLTVKVSRPEVKVQARIGYFALPPNQASLFSYEVPLLGALNLSSLPKNIKFQAGAVRFGEHDGKIRYSVVIEVPLRELKAIEDKHRNRFLTHLSVLALLKDKDGQIVERFSRDFPFEVPADRLEEFQKRSFLQTYSVSVLPGRYTLESAIMDQKGEISSARRISVIALPQRSAIGISSISLVRRLDPQPSEAGAEGLFSFEGKRVVPTFDDLVQIIPGGGISFYFVVYPSTADPGKPELLMELSKDGTPLGKASPELPAANKSGDIPYIASFPMSTFEPGQYELRIIARQGNSTSQERTVFRIAP